MDERILDASGNVAIRYYQTIPHVVGVGSNSDKREYAFVVKNNYCLAWVKPEDVDKILSITKNCCGGSRKPKYQLANQYHVDIWSGIRVR